MKETLNKVKMRLPAILLLAATLLFWGFYDRFEAIGPPLLESPTLADAFRVRGDCVEVDGVFSLNVPEAGPIAEVRFQLPEGAEYPFVRIAGRIRTEHVVVGKNRWNSARFMLIQREASQKWIASHHHLHSKYGTTDWSWKESEFEIEPDTAFCEVVLQQSGKSGRADFDELRAVPVRIRTSFMWFRLLFSGSWVILGFLYFKRCRLGKRRLRILILLNVIVILYGTLLPGKWIAVASNRFKSEVTQRMQKSTAEKTASSSSSSIEKEKQPVEKMESTENKRVGQFRLVVDKAHLAGHFILFSTLCFLVYCSAWLEKQHPIYYLKVGLDVLLFAAVSESLQYLTLDRTPGIHDWFVDVYGMALAFAIFLIVRVAATGLKKSGRA